MAGYNNGNLYDIPYHGNADLSVYSFLITGGAGFIGSNLVEYLFKFNAGKVRVLDNFSTGSKNNIGRYLNHPSFELYEGDIRDYETCRKALEGIDFLSHQAALGSVPRSINDPVTSNEVNITGFLNVLNTAKECKQLKRMVYASSSSVYGDNTDLPKLEERTGAPLSPYAVTKCVNELYAGVFSKVYNFHTTGLRYFNVFGPMQNPKGPYAAVIPLFIKAALQKKQPVIFGDGRTSRDFTFIENVVQANIKALFSQVRSSAILNIAMGKKISLNKLWEHIAEISDSVIQPIYEKERTGDIQHSLADISKAKELIGYEPQVSFLDGLKKTIEWNMKAGSV